jgi:hypothetical protein
MLLLGEALYLLAGITQVVNAYDEGFAVYGAARVLHGEVPYRDFWTVYAPGQFYVLAALFGRFGESILVERLWDTAVRLLIAALVFAIAAILTTRWVAIIPSVIVTLWLAAAEYYGYAVFPALACGLCAVLAAAWYFRTLRSRWLFASGLAIGAATVFRHDVGAYTAICIGLVAGVGTLVVPAAGARSFGSSARRLARALGALVVGIALPVLPVVGYLVVAVPLEELWHSLVLYPLHLNREISYLPHPPLVPDYLPQLSSPASVEEYVRDLIEPWMRFYVPLFIYGLSALVILASWRPTGAAADHARALTLVLLVLFGLALFNHALVRFDRIHALPTAIPALVLLTALLARLRAAKPSPRAAYACTLLLALPAAFYLVLPVRLYLMTLAAFPPWVCHAQLGRSGCADLYPDQEQALAYTRTHTAPGEPIFVGNMRHDRVAGSDVLFYFLAERPSATRYHELVSGVATTAPVQEEIMRDLERRGVRHIVLSDASEGVEEPNASRLSSGVYLLDEYIRARYQPVAQFGAYTIYRRDVPSN